MQNFNRRIKSLLKEKEHSRLSLMGINDIQGHHGNRFYVLKPEDNTLVMFHADDVSQKFITVIYRVN